MKLGLFFGGKSFEHEVSCASAKSIYEEIDRSKYEVTLVWIDPNGVWFHLIGTPNFDAPELGEREVYESRKLDVAFSILHGPFGEDGPMQGYFSLFNIPFVGPDLRTSAICYDKALTRKLAGLKAPKWLLYSGQSYDALAEKLGEVIYVKPNRSGSSVGISRVKSARQLQEALDLAGRYDDSIIIEQEIRGKEIEIAVLGNKNPKVSLPARVIPKGAFHSYETKYLDPNGVVFQIPAELSQNKIAEIQELAIEAYRNLGCEGFSRIDFLLDGEERVFLNEVNTLPGFRKTSTYPRLWALSGISYSNLIEELIDLALERQARRESLALGELQRVAQAAR
ncbi:MAG: D-alanine--D-alanine ligase [Simkaniaceae bacterium]|nr:D-alanine--D-alanine ligase [Simkaniaceae bacterium]